MRNLFSIPLVGRGNQNNCLPRSIEEILKKYLKRINNTYKPVAGNFSFEIYKFLDPNKISVTIVASDANRLGVYHKGRIRKITPREAARIQGFPDSFKLHPNDNKAYYQLGNSVSINVVKAVAQEVILKTLYYINNNNRQVKQTESLNLVSV